MVDEYALATRMRDLIDSRIDEIVEKVRPKAAYAEVKVIDRVNRILTVVYPGPEESEIDIKINGTDFPAAVGQFVRIEGEKGNRVAGAPQLVDDLVDKVISTAHEIVAGEAHRLAEDFPGALSVFSAKGAGAGYSMHDRDTVGKRTNIYSSANEWQVVKSDLAGAQLKIKALGTTVATKGLVAGVDAEVTSEPLETGGSLSGLRMRHRDNAAKQSIIYATSDEFRIFKDGADKVILRSNNRLRSKAGFELGDTGTYINENGTLIDFHRADGTSVAYIDTTNKDLVVGRNINTTTGDITAEGSVYSHTRVMGDRNGQGIWSNAGIISQSTGAAFLCAHYSGASTALQWRVQGNQWDAVSGDNASWAPVGASAFNVSSSLRFKKDIRSIPSALDRLAAVNPIRYQKADSQKAKLTDPTAKKSQHQIWNEEGDFFGFVAEEMYEVMPEVVTLDDQMKPVAVDYNQVVPVLVAAVKELAVQVDDISRRHE